MYIYKIYVPSIKIKGTYLFGRGTRRTREGEKEKINKVNCINVYKY